MGYLSLSYSISLYTLDTYQIYDLQIFSPTLWLPFHFLASVLGSIYLVIVLKPWKEPIQAHHGLWATKSSLVVPDTTPLQGSLVLTASCLTLSALRRWLKVTAGGREDSFQVRASLTI